VIYARQRGVSARTQETAMVTLGNWRERMSEDMRLCDFRPRTQGGYLLAVRLFLE
jgi:hypothetical protein